MYVHSENFLATQCLEYKLGKKLGNVSKVVTGFYWIFYFCKKVHVDSSSTMDWSKVTFTIRPRETSSENLQLYQL